MRRKWVEVGEQVEGDEKEQIEWSVESRNRLITRELRKVPVRVSDDPRQGLRNVCGCSNDCLVGQR